jgi:hypothetical protein
MAKVLWCWLAGLAVSAGSIPMVQAAEDPSIACFSSMADNPALAPLKGKVVLKVGGHPDLAMLADDHRPTKRERDAIFAWASEGERCYDLGHDFRATTYQPIVAAIIDESLHSIESLLAKLYAGKLTYAEFNQQRQASDDAYRERIASTLQRLRTEGDREKADKQAQQANVEAQQRAAAAQEDAVEAQREAAEQARQDERRALALQMLSSMKPAYVVPPPPVIQSPNIQNTNCFAFGNQMHCTTTGY